MIIEDISRATKGCLRDLGYESLTYGCLVHELAMVALSIIPLKTAQNMMYKSAVKVYERVQQKEQEAKKQK